MAEIILPCGRVCLVDDADLPALVGYKLYSSKPASVWYVSIRSPGAKPKTQMYLHKFLTGFRRTDFRNGNGLDNRRSNLRRCTQLENLRNSARHRDATSKFKGLTFYKKRNRWVARIHAGGRRIWGGQYKTELEAALAYNKLALTHFGEFARVNDL